MTLRVGNPLPFFTDKRGLPMDGGKLYIGEVNEDPQVSPVTVYLDDALTQVAPQPILIVGGFATHDGNPAFFYIDEEAYSMRVRDRDMGEVYYFSDAVIEDTRWQPRSDTLSAIAILATTPYGRSLLSLSDAAAARLYMGLVPYLPLTGGEVTGNINRDDAGPHLYHVNSAFPSGRVFVTEAGASDPTSQDGDIWIEYIP